MSDNKISNSPINHQTNLTDSGVKNNANSKKSWRKFKKGGIKLVKKIARKIPVLKKVISDKKIPSNKSLSAINVVSNSKATPVNGVKVYPDNSTGFNPVSSGERDRAFHFSKEDSNESLDNDVTPNQTSNTTQTFSSETKNPKSENTNINGNAYKQPLNVNHQNITESKIDTQALGKTKALDFSNKDSENSVEAAIGETTTHSDGRITAEGLTPQGEKIYFTMVPINKFNQEDSKKWNTFKQACYTSLESMNKLKITGNTQVRNDEQLNPLKDIVDRALQQKGKDFVYDQLEDPHDKGIEGGEMGQFIPEPGYVSFITKNKGFSPDNMPATETGTKLSPHQQLKDYGDILMVVHTNPVNDNIYENRGMFKPPFTILEDGYSGISTMLHAFSARAISQKRQQVNKMYVTALPAVEGRLTNALGKENIIKEGQFSTTEKKIINDLTRDRSTGILDTPCLVSTEALKNLYSTK